MIWTSVMTVTRCPPSLGSGAEHPRNCHLVPLRGTLTARAAQSPEPMTERRTSTSKKTASQLNREIDEALSKPTSAWSPRTHADSDDPYRNSHQDVRDALEHVRTGELGFDEWPADACFTEERGFMTLSKILTYDNYSWGEWEKGELRGLKPDELLDALTRFRGRGWADTAAKWLTGKRFYERIPAIVIFDSRYGTTIGDGRGRVSLAVGLKVPGLYVTRIVDCK